MYIIVDGYNIKITNESESKFVLYGEPEITTYSTHSTYTWGCYDKKGNSCKFMLKKSNNGSTTMSILYLQELYTLQYNVEIQ